MSNETIGARVRRLRKERGMLQKDLAERARVDKSTVGKIESDCNGPNFFTIIEMARVLDVSIDYIAYGDTNGN